MAFYPELIKFLDQSKTNDLKKSNYIKNYQDLSVKVGFGNGNKAEIPWIAFLSQKHKVRDGIYPVYLNYKNKNLLILAYGVSEDNKSKVNWELPDSKKIKSYFKDNNLGIPKRYGDSYVYKIYNTNEKLSEKKIENDLNNLINIYKNLLLSDSGKGNSNLKNFKHDYFLNIANKSGLSLSENICVRFVSSLITKPFVILTGLSGSGKTKLAQAFAMWICEDDSQYCIVPVGADWTNREPLLGFPNALNSEEYVNPESGVLNLLIEASKEKNENKPFFLILDEMNLSHVERYFADFLSVMELKSGAKIKLHSGENDWGEIPSKIKLPENLFIIGTVNIDETTYMFSPKVLDRANVIEFRVTKDEMEEYLKNPRAIDLKEIKSKGKDMSGSFIELAKDQSVTFEESNGLNKSLLDFFDELKKAGAEFGFRTAGEINRFAAIVKKLDADLSTKDITDFAIMQKLLPKLHGSKRKLEPVLKILLKLCMTDPSKSEDYLSEKPEITDTDLKYSVSAEKIRRMHKNLMNNGFTSYAET